MPEHDAAGGVEASAVPAGAGRAARWKLALATAVAGAAAAGWLAWQQGRPPAEPWSPATARPVTSSDRQQPVSVARRPPAATPPRRRPMTDDGAAW